MNGSYCVPQIKKIRTISGVTPVAVLTKPFPCPGRCIFCPENFTMPKSYLPREPGAQRAKANNFDPYLQTFNRLIAYRNIGHPFDKVELIILGGTWSFYPINYQLWFVKRCFDALNNFCSTSRKATSEEEESIISWRDLFKAQKVNESAKARCVGLSIETRPDQITKSEIIRLRKLGVTKVQIGVQSLRDEILKKNGRGHTKNDTKEAFELLRLSGFKIHAHFMINLYGTNPHEDVEDFKNLFDALYYRPDELKIYPCTLIDDTKLMTYYRRKLWKPYTEDEMLSVLKECVKAVPEYCRINRIIRDFSAQDVVCGIKKSNLRQIVEKELRKEGNPPREIRYREIRGEDIDTRDMRLDIVQYETSVSKEYFLQYITEKGKIAALLRLTIPQKDTFISELRNSAIIREIHVYGPSIRVGDRVKGKAQHTGLGRNLLKKAGKIAKKENKKTLSVISAVGTREYYRKNGFFDGDLYQHLRL